MICRSFLACRLICGVVAVLAMVGFLLPAVSMGQGSTTGSTVNVTNNTTAGTGLNGLAIPYRPVGGVSIDAKGVLENVQTDALGQLAKLRSEALQKAPEGMNVFSDSRKVSLRRLEAAIEESVKTGKALPDEMRYLAGLQQIRYVFVYPEEKDIVLVGPGEGWKVDARGNMVGIKTGRPVMLLDDLLVALRMLKVRRKAGSLVRSIPRPKGLPGFKDS